MNDYENGKPSVHVYKKAQYNKYIFIQVIIHGMRIIWQSILYTTTSL